MGSFLQNFTFVFHKLHTHLFFIFIGVGGAEREIKGQLIIYLFFFLFATCKFIIFTELFLLNKVNLHFFYNKKKSRKILLRK